jgi:hypothetical protein
VTRIINTVANAAGDAVLSPLSAAGPWPMMIGASLIATLFALVVLRLVSNREALRRAKGRQTARALEILLYKDDPLVSLGAVGRVLTAVLAYQKEFLRPLAVMIVPLGLFMIQMDGWFGARPLRPGETALVKAVFKPGTPIEDLAVTMATSEGLAVETDPVRIPAAAEIAWRFLAREEGLGWLEVSPDGAPIRKDVVVSRKPARVSKLRAPSGFWSELAHPSEPPLPMDGALVEIEVVYPPSRLMIGSFPVHWLAAFLALTMLFTGLLGYLLGPRF